jgi:hypothetical protein
MINCMVLLSFYQAKCAFLAVGIVIPAWSFSRILSERD